MEARPYRRRLLVNTASTTVANVWAMVVALVSLPLLLRGLGATGFGLWVLIQTFSAVNGWLSLADLGLGTATTAAVATKAGAGDDPAAAAVVRTALGLFLATGMVAAAALTALSGLLPSWFGAPPAIRDDVRLALVIFAAQIVVELLTEGIEACLEGYQRVDVSRLVDGVRRTLVAAATVAVALGGGGLVGVAVASLAATGVGLVTGALALRRAEEAGGRFDRAAVRPLLAYARKVAVVDANGVVKRTMDRVIVGALLGPVAVTLVEIATQVQNAANAILSASTYATISSSAWLQARQQESTLRELLERGTRYSLLLSWPVAVTTAFCAGPIVRLWVGARYERAAFLIVLALIPMVAAVLQVGSNMLRGGGQVSLIFRPALASTVVNLVASALLVQVVGVEGTFYGTLVGTAVLLPALGRAVLGEYRIGAGALFASSVWPALQPNLALALALAAVVALPLSDPVTIAVALGAGGVVYGLAALRWGLSREEQAELWRLARGRGRPDRPDRIERSGSPPSPEAGP